MSPLSSLPDRLRGGDAAALLELAHATHPRALAVARVSDWSADPESLLLDAYVALWLRRADAPDAGVEAWALAEVLAYGARYGARQSARRAAWGGESGIAVAAAMRAVARAVGRTLARAVAHPAGPSMRRSAS